MKSKKQEGAGSEPDADAALKKLEEYGERFMAMFDDDDKRKSKRASTSGRSAGGKPKVAPHGASKTHAAGAAPSSTGCPEQAPSGKGDKAGKGQTQTRPGTQLEGTARESIVATAANVGAGAKGKRKAGGADEIDAIMRAGKKAKRQQGGGGPSPAAKGGAGKGADAAAAAAAARQAAMDEALKQERKLFMSHKASKVHEAVSVGAASRTVAASDADGSGLSPEEFQKLQLEVEKFAVSSLDKKSAKLYKARMLARVGAKAETGPRTALSIGKGMAKMAAKREARALEEAIETGMVQRKGLGKKKRALKAKNRDRGLMEAGPSFKNGILRVKPLKKTRAESGKLRLPKGIL